jgi:hypothetical protein
MTTKGRKFLGKPRYRLVNVGNGCIMVCEPGRARLWDVETFYAVIAARALAVSIIQAERRMSDEG